MYALVSCFVDVSLSWLYFHQSLRQINYFSVEPYFSMKPYWPKEVVPNFALYRAPESTVAWEFLLVLPFAQILITIPPTKTNMQGTSNTLSLLPRFFQSGGFSI
jgi:hypothetical protein